MKKLKQLNKQQGFTIIEVMIVLAIAALILLVVFLAVPNLQRSQRNNARKSDASRLAASIVNFTSNSSTGALPATSPNDCNTILNDTKSLSQYTGGTPGSVMSCPAANVTVNPTSIAPADKTFIISQPAAPASGTVTAPTTAFEVVLMDGFQCDTTSGAANGAVTITGATNKSAALLYSLESGGSPYWACVNPQ